MKILHTYCLNHNLGDYALGIGVKNLLRAYLPVDLIAETNLQGTVFSRYYIDNVINKKYDLLVIGGGGIIHGAHWPNGWFWLIDESLIERIQIPFVVYGAGYNYFEDEGGIPEVGRRHIVKTLQHACFFSLRNDESVTRFREQLDVEVSEVPDPGFHVDLGRDFDCHEDEPFALVQLANDKPEYRFGSQSKRDEFVSEFRKLVADLSRSIKVVFAPHVFDDVWLCEKVAEGIGNTEVLRFADYAFDRVDDFLGYYQKSQFVLAMRGHGQILPIAFGTPVIALENHPKHGGLMRKLGLAEYSLPITSESFSDRLKERIIMIEENRLTYGEALKVLKRSLEEWSKSSMQMVKNCVRLRADG